MADHKLQNSVRVVRSQKGLTQATLAERVGVSRQSINYIERGTFAPSVTLALVIARVLDTTVEELFGEKPR